MDLMLSSLRPLKGCTEFFLSLIMPEMTKNYSPGCFHLPHSANRETLALPRTGRSLSLESKETKPDERRCIAFI